MPRIANLAKCPAAAIPNASPRCTRGVLARLVSDERLDQLNTEHGVSRWGRHADEWGPHRCWTGFWDAAWEWIPENLSER